MNRREFLQRLTACGLVAASPKFIFDLGAVKHQSKSLHVELVKDFYQYMRQEPFGEWQWHKPIQDVIDPRKRLEFFVASSVIGVELSTEPVLAIMVRR